MRPITDILETRGLRFAELKNPTNRISGKDIAIGDVEKYMVIDDTTTAFGGDYYDTASGKTLNFMFSIQDGWEHLSVSMPSKTPSWDQMCKMKEIFFEDEEECIEYHPKKSEYINAHPHCLHIWRPQVDVIFDLYRKNGWVKEGRTITYEDVLRKSFPNDKDREFIMNIYKAETGSDLDLGITMQLYDEVPSDLIMGIPKPPYYRVGMKSSEGYNILKDYAHSKGVKVGLTDEVE